MADVAGGRTLAELLSAPDDLTSRALLALLVYETDDGKGEDVA